MSAYFGKHDPRHFHVMSSALVSVISALNVGRTGNTGNVAIHANSRGYRITFRGRTVAKGSTPDELHKQFSAACDRAKDSK